MTETLWTIEGQDASSKEWRFILDCHADSYEEAVNTGWTYLMSFVSYDHRKHIVALEAKPYDDVESELEWQLTERFYDIIGESD